MSDTLEAMNRIRIAPLLILVACATKPVAHESQPGIVGTTLASSVNKAPFVEPAPSVTADQPPARKAAPKDVPVRHCGRQPGEPIKPEKWRHGRSQQCDEAETTWGNVPEADLRCSVDADCAIFTSDGSCFNAPLTRQALTKPKYKQGPCGNPASGACANFGVTARCVDRCCVVEMGSPRQ